MSATATSRKIQIICAKCQGRGIIARFSHQHQGVCYDCNGAGKVWDYPITPGETPVPQLADQTVAELGVTFRQVARWRDEAEFAMKRGTYNLSDEESARYDASKTAQCREYEAWNAMTHPERVAFREYLETR